jgi:hypothetical protein
MACLAARACARSLDRQVDLSRANQISSSGVVRQVDVTGFRE